MGEVCLDKVQVVEVVLVEHLEEVLQSHQLKTAREGHGEQVRAALQRKGSGRDMVVQELSARSQLIFFCHYSVSILNPNISSNSTTS